MVFTYSTENTLEFSFIILLMIVQKINERKNLFLDTVKFLKYEGGKERKKQSSNKDVNKPKKLLSPIFEWYAPNYYCTYLMDKTGEFSFIHYF